MFYKSIIFYCRNTWNIIFKTQSKDLMFLIFWWNISLQQKFRCFDALVTPVASVWAGHRANKGDLIKLDVVLQKPMRKVDRVNPLVFRRKRIVSFGGRKGV